MTQVGTLPRPMWPGNGGGQARGQVAGQVEPCFEVPTKSVAKFPAKFVAKLRTTKTDKNPLLLKVNMGAGHGGASGRYDALHETAFTYSFMLWQMGIAN